jgi:hypothetical protein
MNYRVLQMLGNSQVAERLAAYQEGHSSTELLSYVVFHSNNVVLTYTDHSKLGICTKFCQTAYPSSNDLEFETRFHLPIFF